jgi:cobalt/nickel transport system ATP-binding protein
VGEIRKKVGLVFQDADSQLFSPTVLEDVMFGPLNLGMSPEDAKKRAEWALGVVGIKELNKIPHYLSGGQQRLVAIAGVLAMEPRILVVDEPTGDLDPSNAMRIEALLRSLRDEHGISVVVALHDMDMAARLADRICIVREGSVIAEGKPENILYDDALLKSAGLEMPAVARLYRDLDLEKKGMRRPLSLDDLVPMLKGPKAAASVRKKQRTGEGV